MGQAVVFFNNMPPMESLTDLHGYERMLTTRPNRMHVTQLEISLTNDAHSHLEADLARGCDPLGDAFCRDNSAVSRRREGITLTPKPIVDWMIGEILLRNATVARVVDVGAGTGRFAMAAARTFPTAEVIAIELNPALAYRARTNIRAAGLDGRVKVVESDFRQFELPAIGGPTLYLGNPPYVRHHDIEPCWKRWYSATMQSMGVHASQLAGMHLHFFARTLSLARAGDWCTFITPAEWLDVKYGSSLRALLPRATAE